MPYIPPIPQHIKDLSDQELFETLQEYGISMGPVVRTTRGVYERKLYNLETGKQVAPAYEEEEDDDEEEEDEAQESDNLESEDEEVVLKQQQPRQRTTRTARPEVNRTPPPHVTSSSQSRSRPLTPPRARPGIHDQTGRYPPPRKSQSQISQSESKGGIPFWVKFLVIMIVAIVVFLVIKNMESDPASEIPEQIEVNV